MPRASYTSEFKLKAIDLAKKYGNIAKAASELGIAKNNISRWKKQEDVLRKAVEVNAMEEKYETATSKDPVDEMQLTNNSLSVGNPSSLPLMDAAEVSISSSSLEELDKHLMPVLAQVMNLSEGEAHHPSIVWLCK